MTLEIRHLGLSISEKLDIHEFYQDILGMEIQREFSLDQSLAGKIFKQATDIDIIVGKIGNLDIEIFLSSNKSNPVWNHICLAVKDRTALIETCRSNGFPVTIIRKEPSDIVFIRDRSGNIFEIKEEQK